MRFLRKLKEPSTWAGFGILGVLFGVKELEQLAVPDVAAGAAAIAAIFLSEHEDK